MFFPPFQMTCDHCEGFADDHEEDCLFQHPNPDGWEDDEAEFTTEVYDAETYHIQVTKLGGGTVGCSYEGSWYVRIFIVEEGETVELMDDRLTSGSMLSHQDAAMRALSFVPERV